jgi:hypothetical protein
MRPCEFTSFPEFLPQQIFGLDVARFFGHLKGVHKAVRWRHCKWDK